MRLAVTALTLSLLGTIAEAHITVVPRESTLGRSQVYTVRVPAEGGVATSQTVLHIPEGVTVSRVRTQPGMQVDVRREDDRIVQITWTLDVHPGSYAEFEFIARNPEEGSEIVWKAQQVHPDGTSTDWVNPSENQRPASVTKLVSPEDAYSYFIRTYPLVDDPLIGDIRRIFAETHDGNPAGDADVRHILWRLLFERDLYPTLDEATADWYGAG